MTSSLNVPTPNAQPPPEQATPRERAHWGKDAFRIGFGIIWLVDAGFKWQPGFRNGYMDMLMSQGEGEPSWMHWWFTFWKDLEHPHPGFFAYLAAVGETLIGIALILGFARKLTYIFGALFAFLIWATVEGFGGPYSAGSTDVGAAIIYSVVFLGLLALNYEAGPTRFSVDYYIEQRVSWWYRIAEVGRQGLAHAAAIQPPIAAVQTAPVATGDSTVGDADPSTDGGARATSELRPYDAQSKEKTAV